MAFDSAYVSSHRGICKIVQIILGFLICSVLCASWYGGASCFGEGRIGFVSGLNFVVLIINIILFLMNMCEVHVGKAEYFFNVIATIMFVVAVGLFLWWTIEFNEWGVWRIVTMIALVMLLFLFSFDSNLSKRHHGDHLPI